MTQGLLSRGDRVLAAVSGGADSVALLLVLHALSERVGFSVQAFHLNHKLRAGAGKDERFVGALCRRLGVACTVRRARVRAISRELGLALEEAGRATRYDALLQVAQKTGSNRVATGHNADDNVETVLLNLVRGTGMNGLCGIPAMRPLRKTRSSIEDVSETRGWFSAEREPQVTVIRPLLDVQRVEIETFLNKHGISWCSDSSNTDIEFRRNALRHRVVPELKKMNVELATVVGRTCRLLRAEDRFLDEQAAAKLRRLVEREDGDVVLDIDELLICPVALRRRMIRMLIPGLDSTSVDAVLGLASRGVPGRLSMARGWVAWNENGRLILENSQSPGRFRQCEVPVPGKVRIPELGVELVTEIAGKACTRQDPKCPRPSSESRREVFDLQEIRLPLVARPRMAGDRMVPFGGTEKKLKEIMIDDKVPLRRRNRLPVLSDQQGILWVVAARIAPGSAPPHARC